MKLDLTPKMKNVDGSVVMKGNKEETMGMVLGNNLGLASSEDPVKNKWIAVALYNDGLIDISLEDYTKLKEFVKKLGISDIYKGQILEAMIAQELK